MRHQWKDGFELLPARVFYALDLLLGRLRGDTCPNCDCAGRRNEMIVRGHHGVAPVFACRQCGLYYRPSGIRDPQLLSFYYDQLYRTSCLVTSLASALDEKELRSGMEREGRDRSQLVAPVLKELGVVQPRVCVLGCSWGYEMLPLAAMGCTVVGIEPGRRRREHGRRVLGLRIYESAEGVADEFGPVDLLLSSHTLEHVPKLTGLLVRVMSCLKPRVQVHITPDVQRIGTDPGRNRMVGREHPLGVTHGFWQKFAAQHHLSLELHGAGHGDVPNPDETVAILRQTAPANATTG